ncbi:hypothetical protein [Streptomyces sp. BP-8]|uniref:DUF11 domain-containing protein n=1 Tax=Streptomyces sirii TaxID=3127701 RepID=A0ABZ2QE88_9ACTN
MKHSMRPEVKFRYAMNTYYLPRFTASDSDDRPTEYPVRLAANKPAPGGAPLIVKNVKVTFDLSALKGIATIDWVNKGYGCKRSGDSMTCAPGDINQGEGAEFTPFAVKVQPGAEKGPAGPLKITVTSANAPTVRHTTQLVVGAPVLTARQDKMLTEVKPDSELTLTPAFGNKGDTDVDDELVIVVKTEKATLRDRYGNCRYDKATSPTKAVCKFSGPLPAGKAYEADGPITALVGKSARHGQISYSVYRAHDVLSTAEMLPGSAPRGTGAPLGLRPVDGSGSEFTDSAHWKAEMASDVLEFSTTEVHDPEASEVTIKGKVGQVVSVDVLSADGYQGATRLTLPEGVSLEGHREGEPSELTFCGYGEDKNGPVECPAPGMTMPVLRVRIDKRVEGAQGTISVVASDPKDPDQENNTAPINVEYLD